jgi:hypothetical protein
LVGLSALVSMEDWFSRLPALIIRKEVLV